MLSRSGEYALRAALYISQRRDSGPVRVAEIAEALSIPRNYLSKILHRLAQAGVLRSTRGPRGGFELVGSPEEITLARVTSPTEPESDRLECLLGQPKCSDAHPCAAHERWRSLNRLILAFFAETTLSDLLTSDSNRIPDRTSATKGE